MKIINLFHLIYLRTSYFAIFALFIFAVQSCGSGNNNQPDLSAIPHAEALPTTELSKEDKTKLLEAAGKTLDQISVTDLQNMFAQSSNQLHVYAFWNSKCKACFENIKNLKQYYAGIDSEKVRIITINIGDSSKSANLNFRSNNIVFDTYQLMSKDAKWMKLIDEEWDGGLPAIFMVNKSEDLFLKYYKMMSKNEIEAILQTLVI